MLILYFCHIMYMPGKVLAKRCILSLFIGYVVDILVVVAKCTYRTDDFRVPIIIRCVSLLKIKLLTVICTYSHRTSYTF